MQIDVALNEVIDSSEYIFIDVRSPGEYGESTIPGAINVPLFTDEERAEVGTIYKQIGADQARRRGIEIVSPKIPSILYEIERHIISGQIPVVFCWRGGLRSKSVATFLQFANLPVRRLEGGYRSYREWVKESLNNFIIKHPVVVLHGHTGVGKTEILQHLHDEFGVIDLEYLAGHRGSAFGSIGLQPRSQKMFENLLWTRIIEIDNKFIDPVIVIEAESQRIGRIQLPQFIMDAKMSGTHVQIEASLETRTERLVVLYCEESVPKELIIEQINQAMKPILKRLKPSDRLLLSESLFAGDFLKVAQLLITEYYDPRYEHKKKEYEEPSLYVNADNMATAVTEIKTFLRQSMLAEIM